MNFQKDGFDPEKEPSLNLTSLIDVMFLLVIFFAVSTTFRVYTGLQVKLPRVHSERIAEEERSIKVVLTSSGEIFLDGEQVDSSNLFEALRRKRRRSRAKMFVLEADEQARHGQVVELMDTARRVGISRLAIATRPKDEAEDRE